MHPLITLLLHRKSRCTRRTAITLMAAASLLLASCSGGEEPAPTPNPEPDTPATELPISFTAPLSSRAATEELTTDFAVTAWKTAAGGDRQYVLRHADDSPYQVSYLGGQWVYDIVSLTGIEQYLRYWDLTAKDYTFSAYAPYYEPDPATGTNVPSSTLHTITTDEDGYVTITDVSGNVPASTGTRWLAALHRRTAATLLDEDLLDPSSPLPDITALTASVPLRFHCLMSEVEFRAFNSNGTDLSLTSITVETVSGDHSDEPLPICTLATRTPAGWTPQGSQTDATIFSGADLPVAGTTAATSSVLGTRLQIPQDMAGRWVKVAVRFGTTDLSAYFRLPLSEPDAWKAGKKYIYTFDIRGSQEIILADFRMEDFLWQEGNDVTVDDPQTNW